MRLAFIPIAALALIVNLNTAPVDTPVPDNSVQVVSSFMQVKPVTFPDRSVHTAQAQELDKQREIARLEALKAEQARITAEAQKNAPQAPQIVSGGTTDEKILKLKMCESGNNYASRSNPKYRGAYQYDFSTWGNFGGFYDPADAPPEVQDAKFRETYARRGASPWPHCGRVAGL